MCKVVIGIQKNNNPNFLNLLQAQYDDLLREKDGIGATIIKKDNTIETFRQMDLYEEVFAKIKKRIDDVKMVLLHTRTKSSGNCTIDNVHCWNIGGYIFAHNGFAYKYHFTKPYNRCSFSETKQSPMGFRTIREAEGTWRNEQFSNPNLASLSYEELLYIMDECGGCRSSKKGYCKRHRSVADEIDARVQEFDYEGDPTKQVIIEDGTETKPLELEAPATEITTEEEEKYRYCDSYHFLLNMPKPFNKKKIEEFMKESEFSGMGVVIDERKLRAWFLVKKECYAIQDRDFAFFFSYNPEKSITFQKETKVFGIPVMKDEETLDYETLDLIEGVHELKVASI